MRKNIMPIITEMFKKDEKLLEENMAALFDQDCTDENAEVTGEEYGRIRNLNKVWDHESCQEIIEFDKSLPDDFIFGPKNTLMLESDEVNVFNCHQNSLIIDKMEREDVWPQDLKTFRNQPEILTNIQETLIKIFETCEDDIQEFLKD